MVPVAGQGKMAETLEEVEMAVPGALGDLLAEGPGRLDIWDYLSCRLHVPGAPDVAPLPQLIRQAAAA